MRRSSLKITKERENTEKPVTYFSKELNEVQKWENAIYLECLAIKEAVKYWENHLICRKCTVFQTINQ